MPTNPKIASLPGYRTVMGQKQVVCFDWTGPNPYVVGGVTINASQFGMGGFDFASGSVSQSETYQCDIRFSGNGSQPTCKVVVFVIATGLEAGAIDLSAETFRIALTGV